MQHRISQKMTADEMRDLIDERMRHSTEMFNKHFSDLPDDLSMIVLKGHLLVEQRLNAILAHHARPSADLASVGLRFHQKVALAKALVPNVNFYPAEFWNFAKLLNQLRNDFAHELEPRKLEEHLKSARTMAIAAFKKAFDPKYFSMPETDEGKLKMLIGFWLGLLSPLDSLIHLVEQLKTYNVNLSRLDEMLRERWLKLIDPAAEPPFGTDNK